MRTKNLILSEDIRSEVRKLVAIRAIEIEWMIADAMACKPLTMRSNIRCAKFRNNNERKDIEIWMYLNLPFMQCTTWMDTRNGQLKFFLERIDDASKIITKSTA